MLSLVALAGFSGLFIDVAFLMSRRVIRSALACDEDLLALSVLGALLLTVPSAGSFKPCEDWFSDGAPHLLCLSRQAFLAGAFIIGLLLSVNHLGTKRVRVDCGAAAADGPPWPRSLPRIALKQTAFVALVAATLYAAR